MHDEIERELAALRPCDPAADLGDRIGYALSRQRFSRGDRFLSGVLGAGLAAAVVIVTLLVTDNPVLPEPAASAPQPMTIADTPRLLAQLTEGSSSSDVVVPSTSPNGGGL